MRARFCGPTRLGRNGSCVAEVSPNSTFTERNGAHSVLYVLARVSGGRHNGEPLWTTW